MLKYYGRLFFLAINLSLLIYTSCVKTVTITPKELEYIYSQNDYYKSIDDYKIITCTNGKDYFYSKTKNKFGWYYLYSIKCIDNQNNTLKFQTNINVFYHHNDITKLYKSNILVNSNNEIKNTELLNMYQIEKGCFIDYGNFQYISVISDNILYSVELEGPSDIKLEEILSKMQKIFLLLKKKIC
jgi:hypothetical protein